MSNTKPRPEVSIILPTYNRAYLLARSINSVLAQDFKNYELLVIDDGSTDDTENVVKEFQKNDQRVKYIKHDKNYHAAKARNTGLANASAPLIAFQDSDDVWLPGKLSKEVQVMSEFPHDLGLVYGNLNIVRDAKESVFSAPSHSFSDGCVYEKAVAYGVWGIGIQTTLIRKECFEKAGNFDERLRRYIDLEMFIRISKYYKLHKINETLVDWHTDGNNRITSNNEEQLRSQELILDKFNADIIKTQSTLAKHYHELARTLFLLDRKEESEAYLAKAGALDVFFKTAEWKFEE